MRAEEVLIDHVELVDAAEDRRVVVRLSHTDVVAGKVRTLPREYLDHVASVERLLFARAPDEGLRLYEISLCEVEL